MARQRKTRRKTGRRQSDTMQGWVWGVFGLGIGLSIAALIFLNNRQPGSAAPLTRPGAPAPPTASPAPRATDKPASPALRFRFYDMLPNFEVVIPEEDKTVIPAAPLQTIDEPGVYVLQAGSFSTYGDADRRKAQLAMLGVKSNIQKVSIDDKVYHRVRIGPVDSLDQLNVLRQQLRGAKVDAMVIRVGE